MARTARRGLDDGDVAALRAAVADGAKPTVWFTSAAVGVKAGSSARVLELSEPAEGDFIRVKPAGSTDELSFGAAELTTTRPGRVPKSTPKNEAKAATPARAAVPAPTERVGRVGTPAAPAPAAPQAPEPEPAKPAQRRPRAGAQKPAVVTTVTVTSTPDGEWTVDVHTGKKRAVRSLNVSASAVLAAAKSLGRDVAEAIDTAISEARGRQQAEVQRLRDQLAAAERALDDLSG